AATAELLVPVPAQQPAGVGQGGGLVRVQDREQAAGVRGGGRPGQRGRGGLVQRGQVGREDPGTRIVQAEEHRRVRGGEQVRGAGQRQRDRPGAGRGDQAAVPPQRDQP